MKILMVWFYGNIDENVNIDGNLWKIKKTKIDEKTWKIW